MLSCEEEEAAAAINLPKLYKIVTNLPPDVTQADVNKLCPEVDCFGVNCSVCPIGIKSKSLKPMRVEAVS